MVNQANRRNPGTAAVLSFVFNGMGQLYNGELIKGLSVIFVSAINIIMLVVSAIAIGSWLLGKVSSTAILIAGMVSFFIGLAAACAIGVYSIVDAYHGALER